MAGEGVVGDLVVAVASSTELGPGELHQIGAQVGIGELQLAAIVALGKHGAGLQGEVVDGEVGRCQGNGLAQLVAPLIQVLTRQPLDQIQAPAAEGPAA